jgi:hypothetical protein
MKTDGVVFGTLAEFEDHPHLEWTCPDCGSRGMIAGSNRLLRIVCSTTGHEFLVVGVPLTPAESWEL